MPSTLSGRRTMIKCVFFANNVNFKGVSINFQSSGDKITKVLKLKGQK